MSLDLTANGPKTLKGSGDGSPGSPFEQEVHDLLLEAGLGGIADLAWSLTGNASVIGLLKKLALLSSPGAAVDGSGTVTAGGAAQNLFGGATPAKGYLVQNNSSDILWISDVGTASQGGASIQLAPNGGYYATEHGYVPPGPVSLYGPTTGAIFAARRW